MVLVKTFRTLEIEGSSSLCSYLPLNKRGYTGTGVCSSYRSNHCFLILFEYDVTRNGVVDFRFFNACLYSTGNGILSWRIGSSSHCHNQTQVFSMSHPSLLRCLYVVIVASFLLGSCSAKVVSGDFKLSGLNTEYVLGSFAVSPKKVGHATMMFTSEDPYQLSTDLFVRLIRDDKWSSFQKAPSCTEKVPFSVINEKVTQERGRKGYKAEIAMPLENSRDSRSHYYYFVITDCSLEFFMHDNFVPMMHYELKTWNDGSHVSADETHLKMLHTVTFLVSGIIAVLLGMTIMIQFYEQDTVHAAVFWVMAAAACDCSASLFEIVHLSMYAHDGIGSYLVDAISAHLEALCDSLVALMLLSVGAGWTLPSDVLAVQQNANALQRTLAGLQSPFGALTGLTPTAVLSVGIFLVHVILAQWGRTYNDDFDSYHDLEHLPGKILMLFRVVLGLGMVICCIQTRLRCPASLRTFYLHLGIVGTLWFQSLPVLTWIVNTVVPYYLRHRSIGIWSAILQTSAIALLSLLVTSHKSSYHKFSHMSAVKDNLTDSLGTSGTTLPRTWTFGSSKVRLD